MSLFEYWQSLYAKFLSGLKLRWRSPKVLLPEDSTAIATREEQSVPQNFWKIIQRFPVTFHLFLAAIAIASVSSTAIFTLLYINRSDLSCELKLKNTKWRTNRGDLTLEQKSGLLTGKYTYQNLNNGKVLGKISGRLDNDILQFDWQEKSELGKPQTGKGTILFQNGCKDFFGTLGLGNWQGNIAK